ncbi:hypothetical protein ABW19_dt0200213 [Dactylella cylindrospora]|nr:hypothetical protein ABW19_dt0200213 [Dactylella cylindrospora]
MAPSKKRGRPPRAQQAIGSEALPTDIAPVGGIEAVPINNDSEGEGDSVPVKESQSDPGFVPPSISVKDIFLGESYTFHSPIPENIRSDPSAAVTLGVDEAGRGPVLDSKKLTPDVRSRLMQSICLSDPDLNSNVGWAVRLMSARDIGAGMLRPAGVGTYNLNAQAHDTTIALIQQVIANGVNVKEVCLFGCFRFNPSEYKNLTTRVIQIFVDTVGPPATYQAKLSRIFPNCKVTVSKKADSLYPSVSVASVVAKVSRDVALEQYFKLTDNRMTSDQAVIGSGYPSDPKTVTWLRRSMDSVFGWGTEARFSWSTAAEMLKKDGEVVEWPESEESGSGDIASLMFSNQSNDVKYWFGRPAAAADF